VIDPTLEELAQRAVDGDRDAVARLVRALQGRVYGLALRMLWQREDAEDATQEILIRVVTRLSQFNFASRLETWVYRVATNYLLDVKKSPAEKMHLTFVGLAEDLLEGLSADGPEDGERSVLVEEVKVGCTLAMLQCLDRPHRLAYLLGEVLELPGSEAAEVLDIDADAFRKRLQRARDAIAAFTRVHCGLVSEVATCQCNRRVPTALRLGRVRADALTFAQAPTSFDEARALVRRVEDARRALELHRTCRPRDSDVDAARRVLLALDASAIA
jgi:RNA polymerase sigma factor (sigma-70 family)